MPPLEGEVPNEREAEGFVRKLSKKTPQSARSGCQLPFQGSQGGFAAVGHMSYPIIIYKLFTRAIILIKNSHFSFVYIKTAPSLHDTMDAPGAVLRQSHICLSRYCSRS